MKRQPDRPEARRPSSFTAQETARPRRGRPHKFGRPSQIVALTLPAQVVEALRSVNEDLGWAIVQLVAPLLDADDTPRPHRVRPASAELVHLPGRRALIVVQPAVFRNLRGVATIPLSDGRAFLALEQGAGLADLEVAILDQLDSLPANAPEATTLAEVREVIRAWRRDPDLTFRTRSIIVVEGGAGLERRPLPALKHVARQGSGRVRRSR